MAKAFNLKRKTTLQQTDEMTYLLRLMMSVDAMRSAFRWWHHLEKERTVVADTDRQMSILTMMGWAGETLHLIKKGENKGFVRKDMLKDEASLLQVWDEAFGASQSSVIRKIHRARDKYFAHWDRDIAKAFVEYQAADGYDIPFIETDEGGEFRHNRFPWAYMAIWHDILGQKYDADVLRELLGRIVPAVASVTNMANRLALAISKHIGLKYVETDSKGR